MPKEELPIGFDCSHAYHAALLFAGHGLRIRHCTIPPSLSGETPPMSTQDPGSKFNNILQKLEDEEHLSGYAAKAAAELLVANWRAALRHGSSLDNLIDDVDEVISLLQQFKASVAALPSMAPGADESVSSFRP